MSVDDYFPRNDLLLGGRAIADYVNTTLFDPGCAVTPGQVYERCEQGYAEALPMML